MTPEWRFARITRTMLGFEDHGFLTYFLYLDYGGSMQGAGGLTLGTRDRDSNGHLDRHIKGILSVCGVSEWENLTGRQILALANHGKVFALRSLPTDGNRTFWISPEAEAEYGDLPVTVTA